MISTASRPALLVLIAAQLFTFLSSPVLASPDVRLARRDGPIGSASSLPLGRRSEDYSGLDDPKAGGGSMLTIVNNTYPAGLGEPLNLIISADSDADVMALNENEGGMYNYMLSTNLGQECLGQSLGDKQQANLGDGKGDVEQWEVLRWNFGDPYIGTCRETFDGGLHLRYWRQNTTGAYFMAVSVEMDLAHQHGIIANGYNVGRDYMVGNLTGGGFNTRDVTNDTTISGTSNYNNYTYQTDVRYVTGLLKNSSDDINHYDTVADDGLPAIDGLVAVLTVKITDRPVKENSANVAFKLSTLALLPLLAIGITTLI